MPFGIHYQPKESGPLARTRWEGNWLLPMAKKRARALGWDGRSSLVLFDTDGLAIAGFVPAKEIA